MTRFEDATGDVGRKHGMRIVVDARKWSPVPDLGELMMYGDLFITLAYRDLRVRYAQTALGLLWAFFQPLATLLILTLIFGRAVKVDVQGIPYSLFAATGIAAWTYFAFVLKESGGSIIGAQEVVRKIYFPRLIIPLSKATVGLVDLMVALLVLIGMFIYHGLAPSPTTGYALLYLLGIMMAAVGVGIWVSALTIRFRDLQHVIPFVIQLGLFITPVAYPAEVVTGSLSRGSVILYYLNPIAGLLEGFRWSILGIGQPGGMAFVSLISAMFLLITGLFYFRKVERVIADLI